MWRCSKLLRSAALFKEFSLCFRWQLRRLFGVGGVLVFPPAAFGTCCSKPTRSPTPPTYHSGDVGGCRKDLVWIMLAQHAGK